MCSDQMRAIRQPTNVTAIDTAHDHVATRGMTPATAVVTTAGA